MDEIEKIYWSLEEVASRLQVNESAIRYWEGEFGLKVKRNPTSSAPMFTKGDIKKFQRIQYLLKVRRFSIIDAKKEFKKSGDWLAPQE